MVFDASSISKGLADFNPHKAFYFGLTASRFRSVDECLADCLGIVFDEDLINKAVVFEELGNFPINDLINNIGGFIFDLLGGNLAFFFDYGRVK